MYSEAWSQSFNLRVVHLGKARKGGKAIQPMMVAPYPTFLCGLTLLPSLLILLIAIILFLYWLYRMRRKGDEEE